MSKEKRQYGVWFTNPKTNEQMAWCWNVPSKAAAKEISIEVLQGDHGLSEEEANKIKFIIERDEDVEE